MAKLLDHLQEKQTTWPIQIIQHAISLLSNVPLRILDWNKLVEIQPKPVKPVFMPKQNEVSDTLYEPEWVTVPRTIHPLADYLRRSSPEWKAFGRLLYRYWLNGAKSKTVGPEKYFHDEMKVAATKLELGEQTQWYLIGGPVFTYPLHEGPGEKFTERVTKFVDEVLNAYEDVSHSLDEHEMVLRGRSTGWLYEDCLKDDTEFLGKVFEAILNAECDLCTDNTIKNSEVNNLAQAAYFLFKHLRSLTVDVPSLDRLESATFLLGRGSPVLGLVATPHNGVWNLALRQISDPGPRRLTLSFSADVDAESAENAEIAVTKAFGERSQAYAYRYHGYAGQKVKRLSRWLHNEFGIISADIEGMGSSQAAEKAWKEAKTHREEALETKYRELCRRIAELFNADVVSIFFFDHAGNKLEAKKVFFPLDLEESTRERWKKVEHDLMEKAANNQVKRLKSIAYRAADTKAVQFVPEHHPKKGDENPADRQVLNPYPAEYERKSAIAVPMLINGLLFGVLEIDGFSLNQFRQDNIHLAEEIADIIGPFLYQREVLAALSAMNAVVLDENRTDDQRYREVCRQAARVFLAEASALFMPPLGTTEDLVLELGAWHNRSDWDKYFEDNVDKYYLTKSMQDSPVIHFLTSQHADIFNRVSLQDWETMNPGWTERSPLRKYTMLHYSYLTIVPVRDPRSGKKLCALSIYHSDKNQEARHLPLEKRWTPVAEFMSYYVAVAVAAVHTRRDVEQKMLQLMGHEINALTNNLSRKTKAMADTLKGELPKQQKQKFERLNTEMNSSLRFMQRFTKLYRTDPFRKLVASGRDPVEYLIVEDTGLFETEPEIVDLGIFVENIIEPYETTTRVINKQLEAFKGLKVALRKQAFEVVLRNLLDNADKYTPRDKSFSVIGTINDQAMHISVVNQGRCLADRREELRIFEYGFRGSNTSTEDPGGTGLGLNVVRTICRMLGIVLLDEIKHIPEGELELQCSFTFTLKLRKERFPTSRSE